MKTPEQIRLAELETVINRGIKQFAKTGAALAEIRDKQLYRVEFKTFEQYIAAKWHMSKRHAERIMAAAEVCSNLRPIGHIPQNESQARELGKLSTDQQTAAWQEAIDESDGQPTAEAITNAVAKRTRSPKRSKRKPMRFRIPGCTIVIEPNSRFVDVETAVTHLLEHLQKKNAA